jgi:hypothetical protein
MENASWIRLQSVQMKQVAKEEGEMEEFFGAILIDNGA